MDNQRQDTVTAQSPIDTEIAQLDDDIKTTKKKINCLAERLSSVLSPIAPTPEDRNPKRDGECSLTGRIFDMQRMAEESNLFLADITERLQI